MLNKILNSKLKRFILFFFLALIPMIPFLVFQRFHMDWDSWFHFSRIYELAENIKHGKFVPDISYFSFNKQGYPVNFFYPYYINYPIALLQVLTDKPVLTVIIFNVLFHFMGLNIAYNSYNKLKNSPQSAFLFSIIYVYGYATLNIRMLNMGTYNQQIAYLFLPMAITGIYQLMFGDDKKWRFDVIVSVIILTLTHLLTTYLLVIYTLILLVGLIVFDRSKFSLKRLNSWLISSITIILGTLIFIVPLVQQKKANDWLKVPAMNLGSDGIIAGSSDKVSWLARLNTALIFQDILILIFIFILVVAATHKLFNKETNLLLGGILVVSILQSNLVPYYYLQKFSFIDMIQSLNRFDIFLYFFVSLFIAIVIQNYSEVISQHNLNFAILSMILYLLFNSQSFDKQKDIFTGQIPEFDKVSYFATNNNIYKGLANSNFGYFDKDAGNGYYRINGFMDYRTTQQIKRIHKENGGYTIDSGSYKIENQKSFAPIINFPKTYQVSTNDFIENAVYFDGKRTFGNYKQDNFKFIISNVPGHTKVVRTSITYLKGFEAQDQNGKQLKLYNDKDGWLAIKSNSANRIVITYHKTKEHWLAIFISLVTWIMLLSKNIIDRNIGKYGKQITKIS